MKPFNKEDKKLIKRLRRKVWDAIVDYDLIQNDDKIMVCLSGGKDSYTLLDILAFFQERSDINFEVVAVHLDQQQPGYPEQIMNDYLLSTNIPFKIVQKNTYKVVMEKIPEGKTMCSLCSRLRRGILYSTANDLKANKIALGHHRDDILETFFLNMFFNGKLETMPPIYKSDNGEHLIMRPLAYCKESDIERYSELMEFPIIPCNLCGSQEQLQRVQVKKMIQDWETVYPDRSDIMFAALKNISPSHMLDKEMFNFNSFTPRLVD